jgi:hypothetical protein
MRPALAALVLSVLGACQTNTPAAKDLVAADVGSMPREDVARGTARLYLLRRLRDPDSAQFRFGAISKSWYRQSIFHPTKFAWELPMEVNAKNSFGGYVGFKPHAAYFIGETLVAVEAPEYVGSVEIMEIVELGHGGRTWDEAIPKEQPEPDRKEPDRKGQ